MTTMRFHTCKESPLCAWCNQYENNPSFRKDWEENTGPKHWAKQPIVDEEARQQAVHEFLSQSGGCCP